MTTTMANVGTYTLSDYENRIVEISVAGVCNQNVRRVSNYTVKLPQNRMSDAMREIHSSGGKITGVTILDGNSAKSPAPQAKAETSEKPAEKTATKAPTKTASKSRNTRSSKRSKRKKG